MRGIFLAALTTFGAASTTSPTTAPTLAPTLAPTSTPVAPIDFCFNMGHKPGLDYVIKNGNATKVEDRETELYSVFYAWLDVSHNISNCSGIHNWSVKAIEYPLLINGKDKQEGDGRAVPLNATNGTIEALIIDWMCAEQSTEFTGVVNITIELPGYSDVTFSLEKICLPPLPPRSPTPAPPADGEWGPGSIFFFTVFILTMVFCIVGCGINYVQQGKTGLEIIPGASTCVGFLGKLFRQPRYTPQMDYDAPVGGQGTSNERFGASYQTDL